MAGPAHLFAFALVGIGGTVALDLWALLLSRTLNIPPVNWPLVGRWIGHMARGRFVHDSIAKAGPLSGEAIIGWAVHYLIGIGYGLLMLAIWGPIWINHPTLLPPLLVSWVLLIPPFLVMMPGMGSGIAGRNTPKPNITRLKSVIGHSVFGIGMFATATAIARFGPITP